MAAKRALSALRKIGIVIAVAVAFIFGLAGTVYLSLRSPEVKVPDIKGKDRMTAEAALDEAGLHMKVRATRFSPEAKPDTILDQLPEKDQVIKVGQTVAVVVARAPKEGEGGGAAPSDTKKPEDKAAENQNTGNTSASNQNENQNKPKKPKNTNKNANNSNNANNGNAANRNANARNANNGNANGRNANAANRNTSAAPGGGNTNANRRAPIISTPSTPPSVPSGPPR
jgi:PASTA domain